MTERVGIIGLGLVGGSIGAALRRQGMRVIGYDAAPEHATFAQKWGLIDEAETDLPGAVRDADFVILAVPVLSIMDLLPRVDACCSVEAVIVDTGSVKEPVVKAMAALPGAQRAVGGHPLAGNDGSGPQFANPDLFGGRPFALCPSEHTDPASRAKVEQLVRDLGAEPVVVSAREHDRVLARTSHLPQLMATVLALSVEPGDLGLAGPALAEMTRLAGSDPAMWRDITLANGDNVARELRAAIRRMEELARMVERGDGVGVERTMRAGGWMASSRDTVLP
jgi:prephenate dehydrogenase